MRVFFLIYAMLLLKGAMFLVKNKSIIDRFDDLIASWAERNLPKTMELLKINPAFKSEDRKDTDTKASTSIQMTMLDCFRPHNKSQISLPTCKVHIW